MAVYEINPLCDARWQDLLRRHNRASVFHTAAWLETLRRTYGYEPVAYTTSRPGQELRNAVVFCRVNSWLTGQRMVSLPFSDHCDPLLNDIEELAEITSFLRVEGKKKHLRFVEIRPLNALTSAPGGLTESANFCFHTLDLHPGIDTLYRKVHKDCIRRKIQRANREGLTYEEGRSRSLLEQFYRLFVMTRRRHGLPPSPFEWLCNLVECLGDKIQVRIAAKDGQAVAGMITLVDKNTVVYKYGASNRRFSNIGGMPFLFWKVIVDAKSAGLTELDFGRCDPENQGLIRFKNRLGATMSALTYWKLPMQASPSSLSEWKSPFGRRMLACAPEPLLVQMGNLLYRHVG